jgi:hypothetical protein
MGNGKIADAMGGWDKGGGGDGGGGGGGGSSDGDAEMSD